MSTIRLAERVARSGPAWARISVLGFTIAAISVGYPTVANAQVADLPNGRLGWVSWKELPAKSPTARKGRQLLLRWSSVRIAALVAHDAFRLTKPLTIVGAECGHENAYYDHANDRVVVCYELAAAVGQHFDDEDAEAARKWSGHEGYHTPAPIWAMVFITLHEIGHELIERNKITLTGREEEAADEIAVFALRQTQYEGGIIAARAYLADLAQSEVISPATLGDAHELLGQRVANLSCYLYGFRLDGWSDQRVQADIPRSRIRGCTDEAARLTRDWHVLIGKKAAGSG